MMLGKSHVNVQHRSFHSENESNKQVEAAMILHAKLGFSIVVNKICIKF